MSLNLRISRQRPQKSRWRLRWLLLATVLAVAWLAWLRGWQPADSLAQISREVLPHLPVEIPPLPIESKLIAAPLPPAEAVVMVNSHVIKTPGSEAFTANLYSDTGKDEIPWPNIDGRTKVLWYAVQSGDSLWSIANNFGLDIDTLRWSNVSLERDPDTLAVGTELRILPVPGVFHLIEARDTIESIAALYGVAPEDISGYPPNALFPPYDLKDVEGLIVPFGKKGVTLPKPAPAYNSVIAWPVVGVVSGGFEPDHQALDIAAPYGSTVYAADAGTITYSGWATDGYGYTVIVDHGNGRETWYNHLKGALLPAGTTVERGTPIGETGSTGHSTAPHVHFELRLNGQQVNPMDYLPGSTPQ
jgi:murein DD-endopeptidase MepM/ murein hydrolase activator NlpD